MRAARSTRASLGVLVAAVTIVSLASWSARTAEATVRNCQSVHAKGPPLVTILSVRNMSCRGAARYYDEHDGPAHTPIAKGEGDRIGRFRCAVYEDLTPPGPSDSDVRVRCSHGREAFRFEYAV